MKFKQELALALAAVMVATVFIPAVQAADSSGIDLGATIEEPRPEIGITVDIEAIDFGVLLPGETSDPYPAVVTNIGLRTIDATVSVEDDGTEEVFVQGITVDGGAWSEYSSQLVSDGSDSFDVALHIPETAVTRGDISGSLTVWAEAIELPVADFSADIVTGPAPLTVNFTDLSANSPTSWQWDFGDGNTSTEKDPRHTYSAAGVYTVSLTATNFVGSDEEVKTAYIAVSEPASPASDFTYTSNATSVTITGYIGPGGDVIIPGVIEGLPVTAIGIQAFENKTSLTSVTIPGSVTSIGNYAFRDCTALTSVTIPDGVTTIGSRVFIHCSNLTSITIPDSVTKIGSFMFSGCTKLTSVTIGSGVTTIPSGAFNGCTALTSVTIPDSVTAIGGQAFQGCNHLAAVDLGHSVTLIDDHAFVGCTALTSVTIPDSVTTLGQGAFQGCTALTSITIPDSVTSIASLAFGGCSHLAAVDLGHSVTGIGGGAFYGCAALTSITIPDSVTAIDQWAFRDCIALTSMMFLGDAPTAVGAQWAVGSTNLIVYYFEGASNFTTPTWKGVPCQQLTVPTAAFNADVTSGSAPLTVRFTDGSTGAASWSWNFGDGTAALEYSEYRAAVEHTYAAVGTFTVTLVVTSSAGGDAETKIGYITVETPASDFTYYSYGGSIAISGYTGTGGRVIIPSTIDGLPVTYIAQSAFEDCTALTSVSIPDSVTSIGLMAFYRCSALISVVIPDSVTSLGMAAFSECSALASIVIPDRVTIINDSAFLGCADLASVTIGSGVIRILGSAFQGCTALVSVTIPEGVISIGDYAFDGCTALVSVTVPESMTSIGNSAFTGCAALTSITIPSGVTSIGNRAFYECAALTAIDVDTDNTAYSSIDGILYDKAQTALVLCPLAKAGSVTIPDGATTIGAGAFAGCTALTSVIIPESVTDIGSYAFYECAALTSVIIPDSVISIGNYAFRYCAALTSITIPDNVTSIGQYTLGDCIRLTSVLIPGSVTGIGDYAFYRCPALTAVVFSGNAPTTVSANWAVASNNLTVYYIENVTGFTTPEWQGCPCQQLTVPTAAFNADVTSGSAPLTVHFTDQSTGVVLDRAWDFDSDGTIDSTERNPSWTYPAAGTYAVSLTVSNPAGQNTEVKTDYIVTVLPDPPEADFSVNFVSGYVPLTVRFTDLTTNKPVSWAWDFDSDGTIDSTERNPSWTYSAAGTYTVTLTATNLVASDTVVKTDYIVMAAPPAGEAWELFQGDRQLTGYYDGETPDSNATKWVSGAINAKPSSSMVIAEGKVFVYCDGGYIAALSFNTGELLWKEKCVLTNIWGSWATPAYHDGLVFMHGDTARYAANGTPAWPEGRYLPDNTNGGPVVAEGKVFVGDWDYHHYYAFDEKTGERLWRFTAGGNCQGTPAYHDGKLFLTSWSNPGGSLYCVDAGTGTPIWHATTGLDTCGSPAVAGGYVYVTTYNFGGDGDLYCFYESNGTQVWTQKIQRTDGTPAVYNGRVYVTGGCEGYSPHQTYCFDALTGEPIWATTEEQNIGGWTCSVVVSADGKVFVGREAPWEGMRFSYLKLFALDIETGDVLWETENGGGTVAIYDGVVFTAGTDGRIYAYRPA